MKIVSFHARYVYIEKREIGAIRIRNIRKIRCIIETGRNVIFPRESEPGILEQSKLPPIHRSSR